MFFVSSFMFETILNMTGQKIAIQDTTFQMAIPAHERLAITLSFLATGDSYHSLSYTIKFSITVLFCQKLVNSMQKYVKKVQIQCQCRLTYIHTAVCFVD